MGVLAFACSGSKALRIQQLYFRDVGLEGQTIEANEITCVKTLKPPLWLHKRVVLSQGWQPLRVVTITTIKREEVGMAGEMAQQFSQAQQFS